MAIAAKSREIPAEQAVPLLLDLDALLDKARVVVRSHGYILAKCIGLPVEEARKRVLAAVDDRDFIALCAAFSDQKRMLDEARASGVSTKALEGEVEAKAVRIKAHTLVYFGPAHQAALDRWGKASKGEIGEEISRLAGLLKKIEALKAFLATKPPASVVDPRGLPGIKAQIADGAIDDAWLRAIAQLVDRSVAPSEAPSIDLPEDGSPMAGVDTHVEPYHGQSFGYRVRAANGPRRNDTLFTVRSSSEIPALPGNYSLPSNRIYLPISAAMVPDAIRAGAREGAKGALYVGVAEAQKRAIVPFTPFIAKPDIIPMQMDIIPATSWGASLANLLTQASWQSIRGPIVERYGRLCEICGEKQHHIECHERWEYFTPKSESVPGIQRLGGLFSLCQACHEMFHLGKAEMQSRTEIVLDRLSMVNRWSFAETQSFYEWSAELWEMRSQIYWVLDLSIIKRIAPGAEVVIDRTWKFDPNVGLLTRVDDRGFQVYCGILGMKWRIDGSEVGSEALDPKPFYQNCT